MLKLCGALLLGVFACVRSPGAGETTPPPERWVVTASIKASDEGNDLVGLSFKVMRKRICTDSYGPRPVDKFCGGEYVAGQRIDLFAAGQQLGVTQTDFFGSAKVTVPFATISPYINTQFGLYVTGQSIPVDVSTAVTPLLAARQQRSVSAAQAVESRNQQAEATRLATDEEQRTGKCTEFRAGALQNAISKIQTVVESDDTQNLHLLDHDIAVASATGTKVEKQFRLAGEAHFLVIGYDSVSLAVVDSKSQPSSSRSWSQGLLEGYAGAPSNADSRVVQARRGEKFSATVKGAGCFLLLTFQRF